MYYQDAIERTKPTEEQRLVPGSEEEQAAIARVKDFLSDLSSPERVRKLAYEVYADDVYFNDTLKELRGADAVASHFAASAEAVVSALVTFDDVVASGGEYYFRWVMEIEFKRLKPGTVTRSIGMTHIRFNREGKVILHQDYWDASTGFFQHVPFVGWLLRRVRARL